MNLTKQYEKTDYTLRILNSQNSLRSPFASDEGIKNGNNIETHFIRISAF